MWALYVEREWVPGADTLLATPSTGLRGPAFHQHAKARLAARALVDRLFPADEVMAHG